MSQTPDPGTLGPRMHCPECGFADSRVVDSRPADAGAAIRRRRECEECGARFTTYERLATVRMVRKRSGELQPFELAKIQRGLEFALADRPVPEDGIAGMVDRIDGALLDTGGIAQTDRIGQLVLAELRAVDEVAYLRFASVYQDFQGASDFEEALAELGEAPITTSD